MNNEELILNKLSNKYPPEALESILSGLKCKRNNFKNTKGGG